ncbi:MAG: hypothetical protein J6574_01595 [Gilliamella sp.]|nr:hypothetical protein [Gilliamella sp.]
MSKNLSQRIAERLRNKKQTKHAKNRADFLVYKTEIEQAMIDGWSVKIIWETLLDEKKITVSYPAFNNYVNKIIIKKKSQPVKEVKNIKKGSITKTDSFNFNSIPNKEDLI